MRHIHHLYHFAQFDRRDHHGTMMIEEESLDNATMRRLSTYTEEEIGNLLRAVDEFREACTETLNDREIDD